MFKINICFLDENNFPHVMDIVTTDDLENEKILAFSKKEIVFKFKIKEIIGFSFRPMKEHK
jgi:hypothetical protein